MTDQPTGDPTHGLSVQHADALWDAVAIPGPTEPTFPMQHDRVCRAVAEIIAELSTPPAVPVSSPPPDQTAVRAAILREEADRIDATCAQFPIAVQNGITWATAELRRHAAECPQCGTTGACNGGPCPLRRLAAEAPQPVTAAPAAAGPGRAADTQDDEEAGA